MSEYRTRSGLQTWYFYHRQPSGHLKNYIGVIRDVTSQAEVLDRVATVEFLTVSNAYKGIRICADGTLLVGTIGESGWVNRIL